MDELLTRRWRLRKKLQYEEADLVRDALERLPNVLLRRARDLGRLVRGA